MKKLIALTLSFAIIIIFTFGVSVAYADDSYVLKSDAVSAAQDETITVPLKLSGNKGLMGFKLTVKYDDSILKLIDVSSGSLTEGGLFNTSITSYEAVKGSFDILWSDSKEVKDDGTLALLTFKIKHTAENGEYKISVTYSAEDTFNESFEDVKLDCRLIKVIVSDIPSSRTAQEDTEAQTDNGNMVSADYLVASVDQIVQSFGTNDISNLSQEQQETVIEYVNNRVDSFGGGKKYSDFTVLKADYFKAVRIEAVRKLIESADPETIVSASDEVLAEYGANTFSELPDDKKQEAIDKAFEKLAESGADEEGFMHINSYDEAAKALDEAVKNAQEEKNKTITLNEVEKSSNEKIKAILIITVIAVLIFALIISVILIRKRREQNEKAE